MKSCPILNTKKPLCSHSHIFFSFQIILTSTDCQRNLIRYFGNINNEDDRNLVLSGKAAHFLLLYRTEGMRHPCRGPVSLRRPWKARSYGISCTGFKGYLITSTTFRQ